MMYYRLALQERQAATWAWKSTVLTSLSAMFQMLRIYSFIPQNRIRVFTSATKEGLDDMLNRENNGAASGSVTAAEFLHARNMHTREVTQSASEQGAAGDTSWQSLSVATSLSIYDDKIDTNISGERAMSVLDSRRLEIEQGTGGDHDVLYTFALPVSMPQLLAWTRLLSKVQARKMQS